MKLIEIFFTGFGLSMDACAAAISKGLSMKKSKSTKIIIVALYFGLFQGIMPIIGYLISHTIKDLIIEIDHWIAFVLLTSLGVKMLFDVLSNNNILENDSTNIKSMLPLAFATSIDALVAGITLSFLKVNIIISSFIIGITTFITSTIGVVLGIKFGTKYEKKSQILGGIILIILGIKILLEHLNII